MQNFSKNFAKHMTKNLNINWATIFKFIMIIIKKRILHHDDDDELKLIYNQTFFEIVTNYIDHKNDFSNFIHIVQQKNEIVIKKWQINENWKFD